MTCTGCGLRHGSYSLAEKLRFLPRKGRPIVLALIPVLLALLGPAVANASESVTVEGTLKVVHFDYLAADSTDEYVLESPSGNTVPLHFSGRPPKLPPNAKLRVRGQRTGSSVTVASTDSSDVTVLAEPSTSAITGQKKVAVIVFNWQGDQRKPFTPAQVRETIFTNGDSTNSYYKEQSFGQVGLTGKTRADGDVFGWYTISNDYTDCDFNAWANAANTKAQAAGVDLAGYDRYLYVFPQSNYCPWSGVAYLLGNSAWASGLSKNVTAHELGHTFGVHHASGLNCFDATSGQYVPINNNCGAVEYGDPFDVMGWGAYHHMNNFHKAQLGWLRPSSIQTVTKYGNYSIAPIESSTSALQLLRIPRTKDGSGNVTEYYYLEFRQPFGTFFDNFPSSDPVVNGISVRLGPDLSTITQSGLVDANPQTYNWDDAPFALNGKFSDPTTGVSFTVTAISPSGATIRLQDQLVANIEGEGFSFPSPPDQIVSGTQATGGQFLLMSTGTAATKTLSVPKANRVVVRLRRGSECSAQPTHATVKIDGNTILSTSVDRGTFFNYSVETPVLAGSHAFAVTDDSNDTSCDRKLRLDNLKLYEPPPVLLP